MYCGRCGKKITDGGRFCPHCGNSLFGTADKKEAPLRAPGRTEENTARTGGWGKRLALIAAAAAVLLILWNGSGGSLEQGLEKTLPYDLRAYILHRDGLETEYVLDIKKLTVDQHLTEGKSDIAKCTVILEDENIRKTVYVELVSAKYDTGWTVVGWTELQEPVVVPKYAPDPGSFDAVAAESGFVNIVKIREDSELEAGVQKSAYSVNDRYEYVSVSGELEVIAEFQRITLNYARDIPHYYWEFTLKNYTVPTWSVLGQWHLEQETTGEPYIASITLSSWVPGGEAVGSSIFYYPAVDGSRYLGYYVPNEGGVSCSYSGTTPEDLRLVIGGRECYIEITCFSCSGFVRNYKCLTPQRY